MVVNFRHYVVNVRARIKPNRQQERGFCIHKKNYSSVVPKNNNNQSYIRRKVNEFVKWYDEFTGMDEVRAAQKMVLEDEENFRNAQQIRRNLLNELTLVQQKLKDVYFELENTVRGDDRYVVLVTQEHKLLKEEKQILEQFNRAERTEREAFSALSSSVKMSHEKERSQGERTKYWSIIGSVLGTVIGLLGSSINNHFKMNELKELLRTSTNIQLIECLNHYVDTNEQIISNYKKSLKIGEKNNLTKLEETLIATNKKLTEIEISLKHLEKENKQKLTQNVVESDPSLVELSVRKDYSQIKLLLFSLAVLSVLMPIVSKYT